LRQREQNASSLAIELSIRRNQLYKWAKKIDERAQGQQQHRVSADKRTRPDG
jgi:transposase-like protein